MDFREKKQIFLYVLIKITYTFLLKSPDKGDLGGVFDRVFLKNTETATFA